MTFNQSQDPRLFADCTKMEYGFKFKGCKVTSKNKECNTQYEQNLICLQICHFLSYDGFLALKNSKQNFHKQFICNGKYPYRHVRMACINLHVTYDFFKFTS